MRTTQTQNEATTNEPTITRNDYMNGRISHDEYYNHVVDALGRGNVNRIVLSIAPASVLKERYDADKNLNNIHLSQWDRRDAQVRQLVRSKPEVMAITWTGAPLMKGTVCWSLSESVCVLKAAAAAIAQSKVCN